VYVWRPEDVKKFATVVLLYLIEYKCTATDLDCAVEDMRDLLLGLDLGDPIPGFIEEWFDAIGFKGSIRGTSSE